MGDPDAAYSPVWRNRGDAVIRLYNAFFSGPCLWIGSGPENRSTGLLERLRRIPMKTMKRDELNRKVDKIRKEGDDRTLFFHSKCHPENATWSQYNADTGKLSIVCSECAAVVAVIAVA